jgi:predicted SprT family Zn-dependent metalloprotease
MKLEEAKTMAQDLMKKHEISSWVFQFDRAKVRFGACNYRVKIISLSKHLTELNSKDIVKNTILHEIAHALVGKGNNHNKTWKATAKSIGCSAERCYSAKTVNIPPKKYTAECLSCKQTFQAQKKRYKAACALCCKKHNNNKYSEKYHIIFTINSVNKKQTQSSSLFSIKKISA